jgi:hypothetical protein
VFLDRDGSAGGGPEFVAPRWGPTALKLEGIPDPSKKKPVTRRRRPLILRKLRSKSSYFRAKSRLEKIPFASPAGNPHHAIRAIFEHFLIQQGLCPSNRQGFHSSEAQNEKHKPPSSKPFTALFLLIIEIISFLKCLNF